MYPSEENNNNENIIKFCKNCLGAEPCMCGNPEYIETWDFVYWTFKNCKM